MGFQQGLSGLNISSKSLEVIGNNVANANTFGFKSARAEFADMYAASLGGGAGNGIGIGARIASVAQQFTQGNISTTASNMDLAINGDGFFMVQRWDPVSGTEDLQAALKLLNGEGDKKDAQRVRNGEVANVVSAGNRLYTLPGFGPVHLVRWLTASHHWRSFWADDGFQKWLGQQPAGSVDLRALAAVFQRAGLPLEDVARAALCDYWNTPNAVDVLPPEQIWPFFAEHPEFIDEGLGLVAPPKRERNHWPLEMGATMRVLAIFPNIPARWMPRLMELALGEGKTHRPLAQKALAGVPDIGRSVIDSLAHTKSEVRIEAERRMAFLKVNLELWDEESVRRLLDAPLVA